MSETPPRRFEPGLLLLAAALACFFVESWSVGPHFDDAFISYRYALNWVEGRGLVFNPGEYVEGYSNLLWTLGVGVGLWLGIPAKVAGHALGLTGGAATFVALYLYVTALLPRERWIWAGIAVWIVYASPAFERWAVSGMEVPLFSAFLVGAFAAEARGRLGLATALAALTTLTRPEGALVAASLLGFRALEHGLWSRPVWRDGLLYTGLWAALTVFRLAYYGAPLPNTFYAKVGGAWLHIGATSAALHLLGNGGLFALPALLAAAAARRARPAAAFALVFVLYVIYVGGSPRYLTPVVPVVAGLGCVGAAIAWGYATAARAATAAWLALTLAVGFFGAVPLRTLDVGKWFEHAARIHDLPKLATFDSACEQQALKKVRVIRARGEKIGSVATAGIGALGFYSGLPIVDVLGVIDPVVARSPVASPTRYSIPGHQRSNADYVFSREPDYILIDREGAGSLIDLAPALNDLRDHPEMQRHYAWDAEIDGYRRVR
jgi:hypothetical protein